MDAPDPPVTSDNDKQVSASSVFWAITAIALNTMLQPDGQYLDLPGSWSFVLRCSPVFCITNTCDNLARLGLYTMRTGSLRLGLVAFRHYHFRDLDPNAEGRLESFQRNTVARVLSCVLGALPQAIKIFAAGGMPWTKTCCAMLLAPFLADELVIFLGYMLPPPPPTRVPWGRRTRQTSPGSNANTAYEVSGLLLVAFVSMTIVSGVFTNWLIDNVVPDRHSSILRQATISVAIATQSAYVLIAPLRYALPAVPLCILGTGLVAQSRGNAVLSNLTLLCSTESLLVMAALVRVLDEILKHSNLPWMIAKHSCAGTYFVLLHVVTLVVLCFYRYDASSTYKPSWTEFLG